VKVLFDQNLSRRLVTILATEFADSAQVRTLGLDSATDPEWALSILSIAPSESEAILPSAQQ
jgi:predicted nuclease of predicted toxin-antitoxin system